MSPNGPIQFFDNLQQNGCSKNPKGSPFHIFFSTMRLTEDFKKNSDGIVPQLLVF